MDMLIDVFQEDWNTWFKQVDKIKSDEFLRLDRIF